MRKSLRRNDSVATPLKRDQFATIAGVAVEKLPITIDLVPGDR